MLESATTAGHRRGLPSGSTILITLAAALVGALALHQYAGIFGPLMLAVTLSITAAPVRGVLIRRGAKPWLATLATIVVVYVVVVILLLLLVALGAHFATLLLDYGADMDATLAGWVTNLSALGIDPDRLAEAAGGIDVAAAADVVMGLLGGVAGALSSVVFIIVLLFFTVIDAGTFSNALDRVSGSGARIAEALRSFASGTRSYMLVATGFGAIVAIADSLVLLALGVQGAWMWGVLAFLTNYIPNVGFVIGVIPPAFIALIEKGPRTAIAVIIAYCLINFVLQMIVQPRVVGRTVGLSASLTFLSLLWWTAVFGGVGAIIAVPMTILVKAILVDHDPEQDWIRPLLESGGDPPASAEPAPASTVSKE